MTQKLQKNLWYRLIVNPVHDIELVKVRVKNSDSLFFLNLELFFRIVFDFNFLVLNDRIFFLAFLLKFVTRFTTARPFETV